MQNFKSLASAVPEIQGDPKIYKEVSALSVRGSGPTCNTMSLGPQECSPPKCSPPTAFWSVQPFLHSEAELSRLTDRLTDGRTDRPTDRETPRTAVTISCISCIACIPRSLKICKSRSYWVGVRVTWPASKFWDPSFICRMAETKHFGTCSVCSVFDAAFAKLLWHLAFLVCSCFSRLSK